MRPSPATDPTAPVPTLPTLVLPLLVLLWALPAAGEWPSWRGPLQDGTSPETGLVASWSPEGENLAWKGELVGRSTPVAFDGRVCANGRVGEGIARQETAVCFDAATGERLWERRWNVYNTAVPFTRIAWGSPAGDPETGHLYVLGAGGLLFCFDREGEVVWSRSLEEELGFTSGYGGRTQTPIVDEDRLIVTFVSIGAGAQSAPRHRTHAFDKRTGELLWVSTPGDMPEDFNSQSIPVVAVVGGQRLLIQGNGDGWVHAIQARTGKPVWRYQLSKRALNSTPVIAGTTVYAGQSEENPDGGPMGRLVAIDATGRGDVTATHETWRRGLSIGFSSPAFHQGRLYAVDNSGNLHALDAATGETLWTHNLGTVGRPSPVVADGRIYVGEVNGNFHILELGEDGAVASAHTAHLTVPDGRYAEIYGSAAVAYGRVYLATEGGIYSLGEAGAPLERPAAPPPPWPAEEPAPAGAAAAHLQAVPAEVWLRPDETARFRAEAFDERGRALGERPAAWSLDGLAGRIAADGTFTPDPEAGTQAGTVTARAGELASGARVVVHAPLPLVEGFDGVEIGSRPAYFLGALARFQVEELDGERVLAKNPPPTGIPRHQTYVGPPWWSDYTVEVDLLGTRTGRRVPDMGLVNSGYALDLMGAHQQLQVRSWISELRMADQVPFAWETGVWYRMKLRVEQQEDRAVIRGKVWPREEPEPEAWTITAEDPLPIRRGSPALYGVSPTPVYYDNLRVVENR